MSFRYAHTRDLSTSILTPEFGGNAGIQRVDVIAAGYAEHIGIQ